MLTHAHLDLWQAYDGDIDGWVRQGRRGDMPATDWALIDSLCQALQLVDHCLAASADPTVRQRLRSPAAWSARTAAGVAA